MRQFFTDCFASLEQQSTSALKGDEVAYWNWFFQGQETGDAQHPLPLICEQLEVSNITSRFYKICCIVCYVFSAVHIMMWFFSGACLLRKSWIPPLGNKPISDVWMDIIALSVANLLEMAMEVSKTSNKILTIWSGIAFLILCQLSQQQLPKISQL